jgi:hypothetical protein
VPKIGVFQVPVVDISDLTSNTFESVTVEVFDEAVAEYIIYSLVRTAVKSRRMLGFLALSVSPFKGSHRLCEQRSTHFAASSMIRRAIGTRSRHDRASTF